MAKKIELEEWMLQEIEMLMQVYFGKREDEHEYKRGNKPTESDTRKS